MISRYIAQTRIEEIGEAGQLKIGNANVLIIGCGALGSPVAMYLAGAGVGKITIADFDNIELSNLQRQIFYREKEVGNCKVACLGKHIQALNSEVSVNTIPRLVTPAVLDSLHTERSFDVIVDAADNPSTTYLLDEFCRNSDTPLSTAGVSGWEAQVFTFVPGSFSYADIFPRPENEGGILPCRLAGIIGPTASFAASLQCVEVLKVILGIRKKSFLTTANLLTDDFKTFC